MNLRETILKKHSTYQKDLIVEWVGADVTRFGELWSLVKNGEPPLPQRGSWPLQNCVEKHPALLQPFFEEMVHFYPKPNHNAIHRNLGKILAQIEIPEEFQGSLYSTCIDWILSPKKEVAVKVYCMQIAYNIAVGIPELQEELRIVLLDQMEYGSGGFKSRAKRILGEMKKKKAKA